MLLPEAVLQSSLFAVLAAFAAVNTVMYGVLAVGKLLPKVYVADWLATTNQRRESRSIYPEPLPGVGQKDPLSSGAKHGVGPGTRASPDAALTEEWSGDPR
jgi:hypothetical protein